MGLDPSILQNDRIARLLSPSERKASGVKTAAESRSAACDKAEKDLQKDIRQYLNMLGIWYDTDAMNRKRSGTPGAADFQFPFKGRWISWEVKVGRNNLDPDQVKARDAILKQGGEWRVVRSLLDCQEHLRGEGKP